MISRVMKRMLAMMMAFVLVLTSLPLQAYAADPAVFGDVTVTSNTGSFSNSNGTVTLTATGSGGCSSSKGEATATITVASAGTLHFNYTAGGNNFDSATINGGSISKGSGTFSVVLGKGGSITVSVVSQAGSRKTATLSLSGFSLTPLEDVTVSICEPEQGRIIANNEVLTGYQNKKVDYTVDPEGVTLKVDNLPEGYKCYGWVKVESEGAKEKWIVLSQSSEATLVMSEPCTIKAVVLDEEDACFKVKNGNEIQLFKDLNDASEYALTAATKIVIPIKDGTVSSGDYTIPDGVTLLVPFNTAETLYTTTPGYASGTEVTEAFRTLTLADGATLNVLGDLSLSAKHIAGGTNNDGSSPVGTPSGPYGCLNLESGSKIIIGDGASDPGNMYAWGYAIGKGDIIAKKGSVVYENIQIADWRGGSQSTDMSNEVFPFSQYYVQNIEAPLTINAGARLIVRTSVTVTLLGEQSTDFEFIGNGSGLFNVTTGSIKKEYDPSTDRISMGIYGSASMDPVVLKFAGGMYTVRTKDYALPITNNMDISFHDGSTTNVNHNVACLPGSTINVHEGANVNLPSDKSIYIYDGAEWGDYTFPHVKFRPVIYSPTRQKNRTEADLTTVIMDINGNVNVDGSIYTTKTGASIVSSDGTGELYLKQEAAGRENTYQLIQQDEAGNEIDNYVAIPITPAQLKNGDGSYTQTSGIKNSTYFIYKVGATPEDGKWVKVSNTTVLFNGNGTNEVAMDSQSYIAADVKDAIKAGNHPKLPSNTFVKDGYNFTKWNTAIDGKGTSYENEASVALTGDSYTLYAQWVPTQYKIDYKLDGGTVTEGNPAGYNVESDDITLNNPIKPGYDFIGWTGTGLSEQTIEVTIEKGAKGDREYVANWTPGKYMLSYDANGGDGAPEGQPWTYSESDVTISNIVPTKNGYTFLGWAETKDATEAEYQGGNVVSSTQWTENKTLYAVWGATTYLIDYVDGLTGAPLTGENPGEYTVETPDFTLKNPTKDGYTFAGWLEKGAEEAKTTVTIAQGTTGTKVFTATWTPIDYTISYELDGGVLAEGSPEGYTIESEDITLLAPSKTGYTFQGWTGSNGEVVQKAVTIQKGTTGELRYKANWSINQYTITFDTVGGTEITPITQDYNTEVKAPENPTRTGYTFADWDVDVPTQMPAGNITVTAQWTANEYELIYDANTEDESVKDIPAKQNWTYADENPIVVNGKEPTRTGYSFQGWALAEDKGKVVYEAGGSIESDKWAANATLYAVWKINQYTITFETADGTVIEPVTQDYDTAVTAPANPERTGYTFNGWDTEIPAKMPAGDMTITALWKANEYTLSYNANGGENAPKEQTWTYADEDITVTAEEPERTGYTFLGWSEDKAAKEATYTAEEGKNIISSTKWSDDATLYAVWKINQYTITFETADGTVIGPITQDYDTAVTAPADPERTGYTFDGWDTAIPEKMPAGDMTITALWKVNSYTITFNPDNGSEEFKITQDYGTVITEPEEPTMDGYQFTGWYYEGTEIVWPEKDGDANVTMPAGNQTWIAGWLENEDSIAVFKDHNGDVIAEQVGFAGQIIKIPNVAERAGYDFAGWSPEVPLRLIVPEDPENPVTVYTTVWDPIEYSITYSLNGGVLEEGQENLETYTIETPDFTLHNPTRAGYKFLGWTGSNGRTPSEVVTVKTDRISDLAYIANWDALQFTASFDANCDELDNPTSITKDCDAPLGELPELERRGYTFNGWYDAEGDKISSKTTMPPHDATYTAKWTANTYKITYDAKGGEGAPREQKWTYAQEESIFLSDNEPTKSGYYFIGWSEEKDATDADYPSDAEIESTNWAEDVTLYAVWGITTYGITYVDNLTNTVIKGENPESYTVETPDFTLKNPTKEGYDFVGWLEKGETEPKKTVTITQGTTGAKQFRLIWTPVDYEISYELDGGTLPEGSPNGYTIESEDIALVAPTKTGYTFLGWTGPDVNEPKKDVTIKTGTIGDLTYTAHWTANPYEVEFEANGATSGKMDNQKFTYDVAQKLTENAFVREYVVTFDYNGSGAEKTTATATAAFEGWEDGDKTYDDKQKVSNLATEGTHKLFAKWTLGSVTLPAPERDGYVFAGWTTDKEGLETVEGTTYVPTEDTTLYAQWIANDYSVIFDGNKATSGEMSKQPFTYDVEQALTKNAFDRTYTVYFEGHIGSLEKDSATVSATFNGWALNDKGSKVYDDEAVVKNLTDVKDGEVTLYADWTLNAITLPAPERAGYTFAGWSTSEDGSMGEIFQAGDEFTPKASQTLFAKWRANPYEVEFVGNGATGGEPMDNQAFTYDKAQNLNENTYVREYVVTFDFNGNGDAAATATAKADFAGWEDGDKVYEDKQEVKNLATEGIHKLFAKWTLGSVELPTPERTGYTFTGWTTDKEGTVAVEGTTYVPTEDTTLYAQWMINKYTAEFDANGGNDADPQSIEKDYDTALGKLPETSRTGYTFNGWFTEAEGGEQITADTKMPVGGATYYAQWTINKHSITFDATNDSEPVKITKDYGSEVAVVEAPEREGHSFVSWNTKADGTGTEYAPGDKITLTDDVKLYAVWDVNQYTITFKTEGGSDVDPITQDYGTEVQKPADPAKKGYTFAGWDGDIPETMPAENLTFTAKWNINQYSATFDDTEGSGYKDTITQDYDTDVTAPEAPDREGYTFLNWNTKADGTGKDYKPGKTIRLEDENITLYAQWQINQYKITFDANGGSDVDPIELDYNAEVKAPKDPSRYGYVFAGWEPALPEKMPAKDLEVKAQWVELEKYTATFEDHNGNTIGADSGYAGETIKVPADPTREGYTFAGWKPNVPEKFPEANTTYVAQWTANEYKAEFDANGGTKADPESMLKDCNEAFGELPVTTREGYTFQGWFTEKTGGTKITEETTMPAGDVTYYAQWAINTYTIEFDTDGGSAVEKIVQKFGTTIRKPETPSKTGHTFNGWNPAVPETMPAANLKLVAQWLVNQYTIVFNTDGGSKVEPITQGYGTAVSAPENPTKTGYTFAGWNAEIPATMPAGNKLIKAMWQINQYTITFDTAGGSEVAPITQDYGTAVTAPADPVRADYAFTGWDVEVPTTMPADDMKITAQWDYIYTGWKTTDEGTTYFENGKQPYKDEFATIDDVTYYFDEDSYIVKGVTDLEEGIYIFDKETGALIEGDGLYDFDGDLYLLDKNRVVENAGLVKIDEDYYFFGEDNKAVKDQIVDVTDAKGYLPEGAYEFGSDGKMINVPVKLTEEIVKLKKNSVEYNGKQQTPTVVVKGFGADAYKVSYKNNIHVGKATVTVTGVEGCFGTVTMHFEITKAKNSWTEKLTMDGWAEGDVPMRPSAEAAFGEVEFGYFADKNCTDEIAVPDTAGTYYVKAFVEGTDDYSGLESKAVKFVIAGDAEDGEGPATGDQNQLALWFSLAMASMAGAFTAYRRRRDEM